MQCNATKYNGIQHTNLLKQGDAYLVDLSVVLELMPTKG